MARACTPPWCTADLHERNGTAEVDLSTNADAQACVRVRMHARTNTTNRPGLGRYPTLPYRGSSLTPPHLNLRSNYLKYLYAYECWILGKEKLDRAQLAERLKGLANKAELRTLGLSLPPVLYLPPPLIPSTPACMLVLQATLCMSVSAHVAGASMQAASPDARAQSRTCRPS